VNKSEFENLAAHATESVFAFAAFTRQTEDLFSDSQDVNALERYQSVWFELEIVNATALAEWESDGRPLRWDEPWAENFRPDALETLELVREAAAALWA
jgi:hypothetical protein